MKLYSAESLELLRKALASAEAEAEKHDGPIRSKYHMGYELEASSSSEDEKEEAQEENSTSSGSSSDEEANGSADPARRHHTENRPEDQSTPKKKGPKKESVSKTKKKRDALVRQLGTPPLLHFPLDETHVFKVPAALVPRDTVRRASSTRDLNVQACRSVLALAESLHQSKPAVVLLLRSGRFAGAVFRGEKCVVHRATTRYTVRKGQGKAQSAQDGSRRPKSVGSNLRREGEAMLREDVAQALEEWSTHVRDAAVILLSVPKVMRKVLWEAEGSNLQKDDERIRWIPLDVGRPTFDAACACHEILLAAHHAEVTKAEAAINSRTKEAEPEKNGEGRGPPAQKAVDPLQAMMDKFQIQEQEERPLTAFHTHASEGKADELLLLIESTIAGADDLELAIHARAGPDWMTPLHYAASCKDAEAAAASVRVLLVDGNANPAFHDARHRVPYFLAEQTAVRNSFRTVRAELGEDDRDWEGGKVGPPLTEEVLQQKKDKRKRRKANRKAKAAKEKAEQEAAEQERLALEEAQRQEEEAKRVRDSLQPKTSTATNVCDFCQKVCRGTRRSQMFQRLEYAYCSTDCVNKHKRELMAKAAMARFGG